MFIAALRVNIWVTADLALDEMRPADSDGHSLDLESVRGLRDGFRSGACPVVPLRVQSTVDGFGQGTNSPTALNVPRGH